MGAALEIDCARRTTDGEVTHVGGPRVNGGRWMAELGAVIAAAERGETRYFVSQGAQQFALHVRNGQLARMVDDGWSVLNLASEPLSDPRAGRSSRAT